MQTIHNNKSVEPVWLEGLGDFKLSAPISSYFLSHRMDFKLLDFKSFKTPSLNPNYFKQMQPRKYWHAKLK